MEEKNNKEINSTDNNKDTDSKKEFNWKKHVPLYILEGLVLIAAVIGLIFVIRATRMKKVNLDTNQIAVNNTTTTASQNVDTEVQPDEELTPEPEATIDKEAVSKEMYEKYDGNLMIGFFGVDSREGELGKGTRSDSIMVCSIDMNTHEVKLISIFRDTYLNLSNDSYNKCNAAYALGGPEQALSMINMNTDLYVTNYITVGFAGLINAIDSLGGVDIDIQENEIGHLNDYAMMMSSELGVTYVPVEHPGMQTLNGLQATAYCRIRYTAGDDFKRAQRQRDVLTAMLEKSKTVSFGALSDAVDAVVPYISTNLSVKDFVSMLGLAADYNVTVSEGFPFEGMRNGGTIGSKGSCVVPTDLTKNVKKLHLLLFNDENYEPSDDVKKYSSIIKADTDEYLMY